MRICITLIRIRISLFTLMQVRIQIFYFYADPDRNLLLVKLMRICDQWSTDRLPTAHIESQRSILSLRGLIVSVRGPLCLQFEPLKLLIFYFNADPAFPSNSDRNPDSQNNADSRGSGFADWKGRKYNVALRLGKKVWFGLATMHLSRRAGRFLSCSPLCLLASMKG